MALRAHSRQTSGENAIRERARQRGIDLERLPKHIAVIMDGNGRWAQKRGLPRLLGHRQGYVTLRDIVRESANLGIEALTCYGFSTENWSRPDEEVKGLMKLIEQAAIDELKDLQKNGVRFQVSGRESGLPASLKRALETGMESTRDNARLVLNLAINYGGRAELIDAIKSIAQDASEGKLTPEQIDETLVSSRLYSADLPDPELLVRTAGEMRVSNFLLWQIAYSEIFVTDTLWPEFTMDTLLDAILSYQKRVRKFGGVVDSA